MATKRYRLYVDESGDHTHSLLDSPGKRYLGLTGIIIEAEYYRDVFHSSFSALKQRHFPHSPDEPVILHRKDIVEKHGPFRVLLDADKEARFNDDLLRFFKETEYRIVSAVMDKQTYAAHSPYPSHPYHDCLYALLEGYCEFLHEHGAVGDVMAESRGGREDRLLKEAYLAVYEAGTWLQPGSFYQRVLSSRELKIKSKGQNISGLQFADLLVRPCKNEILSDRKRMTAFAETFDAVICKTIRDKYLRHEREGKTVEYGRNFIA